MLIILFLVLAGARRNWPICKPSAANAIARSEIKTIPISGRGLNQVPIRVAYFVGLIRCLKRLKRTARYSPLIDKYPVTPGHMLVIPIRHTPDWFSMTAGRGWMLISCSTSPSEDQKRGQESSRVQRRFQLR